MLKVAILDDYQNVAQEFIDLKNLSSKFDIEIFSEPFENEKTCTKEEKRCEPHENRRRMRTFARRSNRLNSALKRSF